MGYEIIQFGCNYGCGEYTNKTIPHVLAARGATYKPCPSSVHRENGVAQWFIHTITEKLAL